MEIKREHQINFWYIIAAFLAIMLIQDYLYQSTHIKTIPYSEFQQLADQGKITDIVVGPTTITGTYKATELQAKPPTGQTEAPAGQTTPAVEPQHFSFSTEDLKRIAAELSPIVQRQAAPSSAVGIAPMTAIRP